MPKLVCRAGPTAGKEYPITKPLSIFGRQGSCDVQVMDPVASRAHAHLRRDGHMWTILDLGSRNGTLLNGKRIGSHSVSYGDKIRIGECEYVFIKEDGDKDLADLLTKYEIQQRIGEGGMGIVFKAVQRSMDRCVALKVLSPSYASKPKFIEQFVREARAAGTLNHPNVIQVHDVGEENGLHFFSMEFVNGKTCTDLVDKHGPMELADALEITRQVAQALEYAHSQRLIHQDIKPDNVMINENGKVKVADLGISKTFDEAEAETAPKKVMGTPHYMAPEAALGKRIDHRVDIYSLASTLFHFLTGKPPFTGNGSTDVLKRHVMEPFPDLGTLRPDASPAVVALMNRMAAKDPDQRFQTATELIAALTAVMTKEKLVATHVSSGEESVLQHFGSSAPSSKPRIAPATARNPDVVTPSSNTPQSRSLLIPLTIAAAGVILVGGAVMLLSGKNKGSDQPTVVSGPTQPAAQGATVAVNQNQPPVDSAQAQRQAQAKALARIEDALTLPGQELSALQDQLAALGTPDDSLVSRYDNVAKVLKERLAALESQQSARSLAALDLEIEGLLTARNFTLALQRVESALTGASGPAQTQLVSLKDRVQKQRDDFVSQFRRRITAATQDETRLKQLREQLPESLLASDLEKEVTAALQAIRDKREVEYGVFTQKLGDLLGKWDFPAVIAATATAALPVGIDQSTTFAKVQEYGRAARGLKTVLDTITVPGLGIRLRGTVQNFADPDLTAADATYVTLRPDIGGTIQLRWDRLKSAELRLIMAALLDGKKLAELEPILVTIESTRPTPAGK